MQIKWTDQKQSSRKHLRFSNQRTGSFNARQTWKQHDQNLRTNLYLFLNLFLILLFIWQQFIKIGKRKELSCLLPPLRQTLLVSRFLSVPKLIELLAGRVKRKGIELGFQMIQRMWFIHVLEYINITFQTSEVGEETATGNMLNQLNLHTGVLVNHLAHPHFSEFSRLLGGTSLCMFSVSSSFQLRVSAPIHVSSSLSDVVGHFCWKRAYLEDQSGIFFFSLLFCRLISCYWGLTDIPNGQYSPHNKEILCVYLIYNSAGKHKMRTSLYHEWLSYPLTTGAS